MSFYWHLNESTGKLVYSNSPTYDDGSGGSWLALEQTNMDPINDTSWALHSYRSSIASVEWDETNGRIEGLTSMNNMFSGCANMASADLSGFDTSGVARMSSMFAACSSLASLDLSGFDTSQVTGMYNMFSGCRSLTSLDLSGFDTSQVTRIDSIFSGCSSLTSLDLLGFDTSKVTTTGSMFSGCSGLRILAISGFMSNVLSQLPAAQYYPAAGGTAVAKADLTVGTWIRDLGDRDLLTSLAQQSSAFKALSDRLGRLEEKVLGSSQAPSYGTSAPGDKLTSIVSQAQAVMSIRRRITALAKQAAKAQ